MRTLSTTALNALTAEETGEVFLILLTISHPDLQDPIYLVNDLVNHISRTNDYVAYPFRIVMAIDDGASFPSVSIKLDNVDITLVDVIRGLESPASILIEVVLASQPDIVELSLQDMLIREISYDVNIITIDVLVEDMLNQAFPNRSYTPNFFQGIF